MGGGVGSSASFRRSWAQTETLRDRWSQNRQDQQAADHDHLVLIANVCQAHPVPQDANQEERQHGTGNTPRAAVDVGATKHHGRYCVQLEAAAHAPAGRALEGGVGQAGKCRYQSGGCIHDDLDPIHGNARVATSVFVVADGEDQTAKPGAMQNQTGDDGRTDKDEERPWHHIAKRQQEALSHIALREGIEAIGKGTDGLVAKHHLGQAAKGGGQNFGYNLSYGQDKENGVLPNNNYTRYSIRSNFNYVPTSQLTIDAGLGLTQSDARLPDNDNNTIGWMGGALLGSPTTRTTLPGAQYDGWYGFNRHYNAINSVDHDLLSQRVITRSE